uniref:Golgin subfamily A member 5 n=1 Tax=Leptobrachium leishanense TaxID=445787 RepID=A0A8C5MPC5_9ANUR
MSWFTDLAGKAEDLLNLVDQGAATALKTGKDGEASFEDTYSYTSHDQEKEKSADKIQPPRKSSFISSAAENIKHQKATVLAGTANMKTTARTSPDASHVVPANPTSHRTSSQFVRRKKSEPDDELLFDFLNSSDKIHNGGFDSKKEAVKETVLFSQSAAKSSTPDKKLENQLPKTPDTSIDTQSEPSIQENVVSESKDPKTEKGSNQGTNGDQKSHELSNLRLENQLLRNEVQSLNQEMAALIQRSKETQEELNEARARIEKWNNDNSKTDRSARELRAQVDDLTEAMSAKDSQLAVLKIRLQEADQLLRSRTEALETLQSEKSRILQDHSEGSSLHSQALQNAQERLRDAEAMLKREQESYKHMQNEFTDRMNKIEAERQSLAEAVMAADKKFVDEKRKGDDLQQQLKVARGGLESAKLEMADYKQKASRILQSKEKLINSLKEGSGIEGLDSLAASTVELEELRHERDLQKEDIQRLMGQMQQLKAELQDSEAQQVSEAESAREHLQDLDEQLSEQRRVKQDIESELERQKQELQYTQEDLYKTKNSLQGRIRDREDEIQKLRNQLTNKALSSSSQGELESRLHQLTETLIQKQTMLENLSTEKNSLVYQLERLETQLKNAQGASGATINMSTVESGEGARVRNVPVLFSDSEPYVAGMYGKVRKAATTIDQFSIRLGIFLRRYPIARVFIIIYMALLHLWVMIVLLTYTPEMHHDHPPGK